MGLFSRLRAAAQVAISDKPMIAGVDDSGKMVTQAVDLSQMLGGGSATSVPTQISKKNYMQYFRRWAFAAASQYGFSVMLANYEVQKSAAGGWEKDNDGPMAKMLRHVSPFMTGQEFWYWAACDLAMVGESYWRIVFNNLEEPSEIFPIAGTMTPKIDSNMNLTGWTNKYTPQDGGEKTTHMEPREVMFLRLPDPSNMWGGYGLAEAAAAEIGLDREATKSMWANYKQGIYPSAILSMQTKDADKREKMLEKFNDRYSGTSGKAIGIADTMKLTFPPMRNMLIDVKSKDSLRDTILAVMKVPKAMLGIDADANRASIWGMQTIFARNALQPMITMMTARINQDVGSLYEPEQKIVFDDVAPEDVEIKMKQEDQDLKNAVITINEVRERRGLEQVEWGNEPLLSRGIAPLSEAEEATSNEQNAKADRLVRLYNKDDRERIVTAWEKAQKPYRDQYEKAMRSMFSAIEKDVIDALERDYGQQGPETPNADMVLDIEKLRERIKKAKGRIDREGVYLGGEFNNVFAQNEGHAVTWEKDSPTIDMYTQNFTGMYADEIAQSTHEKVKSTIADSISKRSTFDEIKASIIDVMGEMKESRAATIAVTETTRMWNAGGDAWRQENKVPRKQWLATLVNTRETHAAADGQIVGQGENFRVGADSMQFPATGSLAEENVNCNCMAVGIF